MVRFWKSRIEQPDADLTFPIGLIYGPSGCGKSSFMKAGLLPLLPENVVVVHVESTAQETEQRLLANLRKQIPTFLPTGPWWSWSRRCGRSHSPLRHKTLIVLDQFEQWLHATTDYENSTLTQALRQCDGTHVQCILMVRDDFWMAVTRLLHALEVGLVEGENSGTIDLFPPRHARKVLAAFGRAFGNLPEESQPLSCNPEGLSCAGGGRADRGRTCGLCAAGVVCRNDEGQTVGTATLQRTGGAEGVGVTFLEETFASPSAPPEHRYHQQAARRVLGALLPEPGTGIKGRMCSYDQLLDAFGLRRPPGGLRQPAADSRQPVAFAHPNRSGGY